MNSAEKKKPKRAPRVANSFTLPEINAVLTVLENAGNTVVGRSEPALNVRRKMMRMRHRLEHFELRDLRAKKESADG
jgi:hypothetical protein